jgi:hypothetical protein
MPLRSIAQGGPGEGLEQCTAARRPTVFECWHGMRSPSFSLAHGLRFDKGGRYRKGAGRSDAAIATRSR